MKIRLLLILWLFVCGSTYGAPPVILVLGDSLSSAHGLDIDQGWVSLLQHRLQQDQYPHHVVNASVSGDTTANGLTKLAAMLEAHRPAIVVVELGGNDGLRAQPTAMIRDNLDKILQSVGDAGGKVVLAGMRLPPNYGPAYVGRFERIYPDLARKHDAVLVPFIMDGVATAPNLMQADNIHPSAEAQSILLDNVWPYLQPLLD